MDKIITLALCLILFSCHEAPVLDQDWDHYLGDPGSSQYSPLTQIDPTNVVGLKVAWTYDGAEANKDNRSQIQCNPLVIDGILYGTGAILKLHAINAETGERMWTFDPTDGEGFSNFGMGVNRGLAVHRDTDGGRILYSVGDRLHAVDLTSGERIPSFGDRGSIDLHDGLGKDVDDLFIVSNSPGIVHKDLIIMGSRVSENVGAAPGHIRAFDVKTGEQRWIFHTVPEPGEYGYDTWPENAHRRIGGANAWAGFSIDHERETVYVPLGSASYDFYGGDRHGSNLFANCILALDANDGTRKWHYQTVHHDLWDKDIPAPANLITIEKDGKEIDVVSQITKNGLLFVLDRDTGEPIYPIEEVGVPSSTLRGEQSWPTQPIPTRYPAFARTTLTEADLATRSEEAAAYAKYIWDNTFHDAGMYEPTTEEGTIIFPGYDGGGEWGGAAYDPRGGDLIMNSNEMPWRSIMDEVKPTAQGEGLYKSHCQNCHGPNFEGSELFGNVPALANLKDRLPLEEAKVIMKNGKGVMPGVSWLDDKMAKAIYDYVNGDEDLSKKMDSNWPYPYRLRGYEKLYAPDGLPIINPPWGQLTSIDMNTAEINWQIPLGNHDELAEIGMTNTGTENYGGPVVTAGGLIFIAATMDEKIRAYDAQTGQELWSHKLPAAGYATPAVYAIDGKQYVVIACGGGKLNTKSGDSYVAFSL